MSRPNWRESGLGKTLTRWNRTSLKRPHWFRSRLLSWNQSVLRWKNLSPGRGVNWWTYRLRGRRPVWANGENSVKCFSPMVWCGRNLGAFWTPRTRRSSRIYCDFWEEKTSGVNVGVPDGIWTRQTTKWSADSKALRTRHPLTWCPNRAILAAFCGEVAACLCLPTNHLVLKVCAQPRSARRELPQTSGLGRRRAIALGNRVNECNDSMTVSAPMPE